jgi:hypothetical protein
MNRLDRQDRQTCVPQRALFLCIIPYIYSEIRLIILSRTIDVANFFLGRAFSCPEDFGGCTVYFECADHASCHIWPWGPGAAGGRGTGRPKIQFSAQVVQLYLSWLLLVEVDHITRFVPHYPVLAYLCYRSVWFWSRFGLLEFIGSAMRTRVHKKYTIISNYTLSNQVNWDHN